MIWLEKSMRSMVYNVEQLKNLDALQYSKNEIRKQQKLCKITKVQVSKP